jgi:hypothetical protein
MSPARTASRSRAPKKAARSSARKSVLRRTVWLGRQDSKFPASQDEPTALLEALATIEGQIARLDPRWRADITYCLLAEA